MSIKPKLLLHSCCASCLTAVQERLKPDYQLTAFWFNSNIWPEKESVKRYDELIRFCSQVGLPVIGSQNNYQIEHQKWQKGVRGLENEQEKGRRCEICYEMRLEETAKVAKKLGFDYFVSELSISPHKNSAVLNRLGQDLGKKHQINYLPSDFKKENGFKRSVELSNKYQLYRQNYCGCEYSLRRVEKPISNS